MRTIAERALTLTRSSGAAVALLQADEMVCMANSGSNAPGLGARLKAGAGFSGECVRSARLLRCDDSESDERVDRESCHLLGIRSMIAVPLRSQARVTGLLEVCSPQPKNYGANDEIVLNRLAGVLETVLSRSTPPPAPSNLQGRPFHEVSTSVERPQPLPSMAYPSQPTTAFPEERKASSVLPWALVIGIPVLVTAFWLRNRPELWKGISNLWTSQSQSASIDRAMNHAGATAIHPYASDLTTVRQLAAGGDPAAQFAFGTKFAIGEEVPQNYSEAARWFTSAAEQGHTTAQAILAGYYIIGRGVQKDLAKAYFWSVLAQAGGNPSSRYRLAFLESQMNPSQIIAARQQADAWLRQRAALNGKPLRK